MDADFKATEQIAQSGAQESVVDSPESQTGGEENAALDDRGGVVAAQEEHGEEKTGNAGEGGGEHRDPDGADQGEGKNRTREDNAAIRAARLRAKREAEAEAAARADEEIAKSGVMNPYTGKPFANLKEFREYGDRLKTTELTERAKKSGRSVDELREEEDNKAFLARLRRSEEQKSETERKQKESSEFVERDVLDFVDKHPDMDAANVLGLLENQKFRKFCGSRIGKEPLSELYDDYSEFVGEAEAAAAARAQSKAKRSTGGGSSGGVTLSPSQQRDLNAWNEANPDLAMTAKEFLSR